MKIKHCRNKLYFTETAQMTHPNPNQIDRTANKENPLAKVWGSGWSCQIDTGLGTWHPEVLMEYKEVEIHEHNEKQLKNANMGSKCLRWEKKAGMSMGVKVKEVKKTTTFIISCFHFFVLPEIL